MAELTKEGLIVERLSDIIINLEEGFKAIYGNDIDLSPDSPDGQLAGLIAQARADMEDVAESIYRSIDPDYATGVDLNRVVSFAGLQRRTAAYSYLPSVVLMGTPNTNIVNGSVAVDNLSQRWQLVDDIRLGADGSAKAIFRSVELGAFSLPAHSELAIETITLGWSAAETISAAEMGAQEESDADLQARFFVSRAKPSKNCVDGITAQIMQLSDVKQAVVLENIYDAVDENGLPPRSINAIVDGGDDTEIASVIYENKTAGAKMFGSTEITLTLEDGSMRVVRFDRPNIEDVFIYIELERISNFRDIDTGAIKSNLGDAGFSIGEDIYLSRLISIVNLVQGFWIRSIKVGFSDDNLIEGNLGIDVRGMARILPDNVEVLVV